MVGGCLTNLFGVVSLKSEFPGRFASSVFAPIEIHAPRAAEGERGTTGVGVLALTCTGPAAMNTKEGISDAVHSSQMELLTCALVIPNPLNLKVSTTNELGRPNPPTRRCPSREHNHKPTLDL